MGCRRSRIRTQSGVLAGEKDRFGMNSGFENAFCQTSVLGEAGDWRGMGRGSAESGCGLPGSWRSPHLPRPANVGHSTVVLERSTLREQSNHGLLHSQDPGDDPLQKIDQVLAGNQPLFGAVRLQQKIAVHRAKLAVAVSLFGRNLGRMNAALHRLLQVELHLADPRDAEPQLEVFTEREALAVDALPVFFRMLCRTSTVKIGR